MKQPADVVELASELIRRPSVNPDGDPGTDQVGEQACAEYVADFLRTLGAEVELRPVHPGRPNVVARFPAPGKPRLLFAPHTDTVSVGGMTIDPFGGEVREGKLYGRGASDTKGPMAAMLWALHESRADLGRLSHEIWFAGLMGEEAGQDGSKALAMEETFDFVIVGEPTELTAVYTHKVNVTARLVARGVAAHSSNPALGDNAIYKLVRAISRLQEALGAAFAQVEDPVLGRPTFNVGTIRGGTKFNIVPDRAEAVLDLRLLPAQWQADEAAEVFALLREACPEVEIERIGGSEALDTDPDHPMVQRLVAAGAGLGGAPWFCDAAIFGAAGMPAVAIGPGSVAQAHTKDEFIAVDALEQGVAFFKKFLAGLRSS
jgi:acetylornithine deacetylase/succinyl-diaminopimelate desuccinylase-like protein